MKLKFMRNQDDPHGFVVEKLRAYDYCKGGYALSPVLYYKSQAFVNYYRV